MLCYLVMSMNIKTTHNPAPIALEATQLNTPSHRDKQSDGNPNIVLHHAHEAKEKLVKANVPGDVVAAITALGPKKPALMAALVDCACSDDTSRAIAQRYSVHESTLSCWTKRIGLPMRRRGRPVLKEPTAEHLRILDLVRMYGGAEAARRCSVSRQWVSRIVCEWEPQLGGRRRTAKATTVRPHERRPRRNLVISFRMSAIEWDRLLAAQVTDGDSKLSGPSKARAIVLNHIAPYGGDDKKPTNSAESSASGTMSTEVGNVYDQTAA